MPSESPDRREAMTRIAVIVAAATGLSTVELEEALAQEPRGTVTTKKPAVIGLLDQQAMELARKRARAELDALQVLVRRDRSVFESVYGRPTSVTAYCEALYATGAGFRPGQRRPPGEAFPPGGAAICDIYTTNGGGAGPTELNCRKSNTCNGQDLGDGECGGTNLCPSQSCTLDSCGRNKCNQQECSGFNDCGEHDATIVSADLLDQFKRDPFVRELLTELGAKDTAALAEQLQSMLAVRARPFTE